MKTIYAKLLFVFVLIFMIGCLHYQDAITFIKSNYQAQKNQKDYIVKVKTKSKTLEIPLEEYRKPIEEIKSQKRSQYRKRYELLDQYEQEIQNHVRPLLRVK